MVLLKPIKTAIVGPTAVGTTLTDIGSEIVLGGHFDELWIELYNGSAAQALTDFALLVQTDTGAQWHSYCSGATWGSGPVILPYSSGNLNTTGTESFNYARIDIGSVYAVKFQAKVGADTAAVTVRAVAGVQ